MIRGDPTLVMFYRHVTELASECSALQIVNALHTLRVTALDISAAVLYTENA